MRRVERDLRNHLVAPASLLERAGGNAAVYTGNARDWPRALERPLATGQ
jgi:hypothetical protein